MWLDWLVFCDYGLCVCPMMPLTTPTILVGFLLPWTWGISSQLLQQSTAAAPYIGCRVSPHSHCSWPWTWGISSWLLLQCAAASPVPPFGEHFTHSQCLCWEFCTFFLSEINPVAFYHKCCMQSSFFGSANKNLVFHFIVSTNSCALCTVTPNRPKYNLEQIKIYFKAMQGDG